MCCFLHAVSSVVEAPIGSSLYRFLNRTVIRILMNSSVLIGHEVNGGQNSAHMFEKGEFRLLDCDLNG